MIRLPMPLSALRLAHKLGVGGLLLGLSLLLAAAAAVSAYGVMGMLRLPGAPVVAVAVAAATVLCVPLAGAVVLAFVARLERTASVLAELAQPVGPGAAQNRRQFLVAATREWSRCKRHQEDAALLLIDADEFEAIRRAQGEECGEALMREVIRMVAKTLRQSDLLARFGGEGLAVYLPRTDPLGALDVAERVRSGMAATGLRWKGTPVRSTASIGVASASPAHTSLDELIQDAGSALHQAREAGRNCVRAAPIRPQRRDEPRPIAKR